MADHSKITNIPFSDSAFLEIAFVEGAVAEGVGLLARLASAEDAAIALANIPQNTVMTECTHATKFLGCGKKNDSSKTAWFHFAKVPAKWESNQEIFIIEIFQQIVFTPH